MDSYCSKCDKYHHPSRKESPSNKKSGRDCRRDQRKRNSCSPCKIKIITKSNIPGPTGPTGPIGPTGPSGSSGTGHTGHTGNTGISGGTGHTGGFGPQGEIGIGGEQGPTGPIGPTGQQGGTGSTGKIGPLMICRNYVTEQNPNGTIIGADPNGDPDTPLTIIKFLYTGPIGERTVTLLLNIVTGDGGDYSILNMLEVSCLPPGTPIVFDASLQSIGSHEIDSFDLDGSESTICIIMKVNPTISNSVWQLGRLNEVDVGPSPFDSVRLLDLCIN